MTTKVRAGLALLVMLLMFAPAFAAAKKKPLTTKKTVATHKASAKTKRTAREAEAGRHHKSAREAKADARHKPALVKQTVLVHGRRVTRYVPAKPELVPVHRYSVPPTPRSIAPAAVVAAPSQQPDPTYTPPAPPTALADEPTQGFLYPAQLAPFFKSLAELPAATATGALNTYPDEAATVRILQFGDSHTAADMFTGAVRSQLQARFGNGGLGFQYPGHPFAGYHLAGSSRSQSSGWLTEGNKFTQLGNGDLGLGGVSLSTHHAGEYVLLTTTCTSFELEFLRQPGGGRLRLVDNGTTVADIPTDTAADDDPSGNYIYPCTPGQHELQVSTLDAAPVKLLGMITEQPGITYEEIGLNGAVATLMLRWNQALFADYLRDRSPALIVLAYGTNEAVYIATHSEEYLQQFEQLIGNLHRIVPQAAILVLGPYDRATRVGRGRHTSWATFYGTERVIAEQKLACRTLGCAFYDQQQRMGGPGSMIRWASEGLAQPDHTHLTGAGYRTMADAFYRDLMQAYATYQQQSH